MSRAIVFAAIAPVHTFSLVITCVWERSGGREAEEERFERTPNGELPATEKQRHAHCRWGVERERTEDPGPTRGEASKWLGALIAKAKTLGSSEAERESRSAGANGKAPLPPMPSEPVPPSNGGAEPCAPRPEQRHPAVEPESLEIEMTAPRGSLDICTGVDV